jgi:hypothetical protein
MVSAISPSAYSGCGGALCDWDKKGITASERFRYLYQEEELEPWAPRIKELASDNAKERQLG